MIAMIAKRVTTIVKPMVHPGGLRGEGGGGGRGRNRDFFIGEAAFNVGNSIVWVVWPILAWVFVKQTNLHVFVGF